MPEPSMSDVISVDTESSDTAANSAEIMAAFFKSFRKGGEETALTRKSGRHAHNVFLL